MNLGQFFALVPGRDLYSFISECKKTVLQVAGNQQYVKDNPHLTFYVNDFKNFEALEKEVGSIVPAGLDNMALEGWHTFEQDPLTGKKTLVIKTAASAHALLKDLQSQIISKVQPYRTLEPLSQYSNTQNMNPQMKNSLERFGFPFTGDIWESHFTVASITPESYPRVWESLKKLNPPDSTSVGCLSFNLIKEGGFDTLFEWSRS